MMKQVLFLIFLIFLLPNAYAQQDSPAPKPSSLAFHVFYNDFESVRQIRNGSLMSVIKNGQWRKLGDMQMGFGFNYLKGLRNKIDAVITLDGSSTDYLFRNGSNMGSSKLLLDGNVMLNFKLSGDKQAVVPYLTAGAGLSAYAGKTGFYMPAGFGLQFNLFGEAFVLADAQSRFALSSSVNHHFQYSVGIGTGIVKKKKPKLPLEEIIKSEVAAPLAKVQPQVKDIAVSVKDAETGLALSGAEVTLQTSDKVLQGFSDANGRVIFSGISASDYAVNGIMNGIKTDLQKIPVTSFNSNSQEINVSLSHNDPRFTLAGIVTNRNTASPEPGVTVLAENLTFRKTAAERSDSGTGAFKIQLEAESDFTVSGRKAGFISNIEKLSTKGLTRSSALYVKLELDVEEAVAGKAIELKNIYYDLGSSRIRPEASSDLEKLILFLKDNASIKIEIASHSDSRGNDSDNLILSQARAMEVVRYLQHSGISGNRLIPKGYGESILVNHCANGVMCSDTDHERNRRTEFKVIDN